MMTPDDHQLVGDPIVDRLVAELRVKERMDVSFPPAMVFQLAALVQLALRHPLLPDEPRATGEGFLVLARKFFDDCPAVLDVLARGDDPAQDRPWSTRL